MNQKLCRHLLAAATLFASLFIGAAANAQAIYDEFAELEVSYKQAEQAYLDALSDYLPDAYRATFAGLSDRMMKQIADARRLWEFWSIGGTNQYDFDKQFLGPIDQNPSADELAIDFLDHIGLGEQTCSQIGTARSTALIVQCTPQHYEVHQFILLLCSLKCIQIIEIGNLQHNMN